MAHSKNFINFKLDMACAAIYTQLDCLLQVLCMLLDIFYFFHPKLWPRALPNGQVFFTYCQLHQDFCGSMCRKHLMVFA